MAVRRERVILDLQDDFTPGIARAAAATALLNRNLGDLDGRAVRLRRPISDAARETDRFSVAARGASRDVTGLANASQRSDNSINQLTGRLQAMAKAGIALGPALIPIGAVGIPAITGLASQLGFAAIGMGTLVVAAQGVGDALKAVNDAALEPTAANLQKAREAMAKLGPEAQEFVNRFQGLRPVLGDIRDAASRGWFPGLTESLGSLDKVAPRIESLFETIGRVGGNLVAEGAEALAGPEWEEFIAFVQREAPEALDDLGRTVGNLAKGLAELWMAFDPLNDSFSSFLLDASRGFASWADGLKETEGFQEFIDYIRASGPQVRDTLAEMALAIVAIVKAAAPIGGPILEGFEAIAEVVKTIAESPMGSKIFAMAAAFIILNKTLAVTAGLMARAGFVGAAGALRGGGRQGGQQGGGAGVLPMAGQARSTSGALTGMRRDMQALNRATNAQIRASRNLSAAQARVNAQTRIYGATAVKAGAGVAAFAVGTGTVGEGLNLQNTAMLGLVGSMMGPWGAAIGGTIGLYADLKKSIEEVNTVIAEGDNSANAKLYEDRMAKWNKPNMSWINGGLNRQNVEDAWSFVNTGETVTGKLQKEAGKFGSAGSADIGSIAEATRMRDEQADSTRRAAAAELGLSAAASDVAASVGMSNKSMLESISVMERRTQTALGAFGAETRWRDALKAATEQAKSNNKGIRGMSQAAIDNRAHLENLSVAWMTQRDAMVANGASAGAIEGKYRKARRAFVLTAVAMGVPIERARQLARELIAIPESVRTRITVEDNATARIKAIKSVMDTIQDKTVRITSINDGGAGKAYGGYTGRGGKFQPAGIVHRDEVVIPKELVHRDRKMLISRYGHLPGMEQLASGGYAGHVAPPQAAVDYSRTAATASVMSDPAVLARLASLEAAVNRNTRVTAVEHSNDRNAQRAGSTVSALKRPRRDVPR